MLARGRLINEAIAVAMTFWLWTLGDKVLRGRYGGSFPDAGVEHRPVRLDSHLAAEYLGVGDSLTIRLPRFDRRDLTLK